MRTSYVHGQTTIKAANGAKPSQSKQISWEIFQRKYLTKEDHFKYEWVNGTVEKTKRGMDKTQLYIQYNLQNWFRQLIAAKKVEGDLIAEPDLFFLENHRRPDIVWLTEAQIYKLSEPDAYEVPTFVIEVISSGDQMEKVREKMLNYRDAGVQVVWHIFPKHRQVDVYSGKKLNEMVTCSGDEICSAAPALPNFKIAAVNIFAKK